MRPPPGSQLTTIFDNNAELELAPERPYSSRTPMTQNIQADEAAVVVERSRVECATEVDLIERLLSALGYNSLRWSWELLLKGYYAQAIALSRTSWEAWLHGAYLSLYPEVELKSRRDFDQRPKPSKIRQLVASRAGKIAPKLNVKALRARSVSGREWPRGESSPPPLADRDRLAPPASDGPV